MRISVAVALGGPLLAATAWTAVVAAAPAADPVKGKTVFARCAACHRIDKAAAGGIGPNLAGVHGRVAGQLPGYTYSAAMKASRLTWNDANLSRFLAGPSKTVPGTKMMAAPITNPQDRANLIAYLKAESGQKK